MAKDSFSAYIQAELRAIRVFRQAEITRLGYEVTEDEAAATWIELGHAAAFRQEHEERQTWATDMQSNKHSNPPRP